MTDVNELVEDAEVLDYKSMYEETQKKLDVVAAHKDKLYQETKQAKAERAQTQKDLDKAAEEKSAKDGEFEKLWQTTKTEKEDLMKRLSEIQNANRKERVTIAALKISNELADGDNVELLSEFVQRNLDKLADESGALSAEVVEAIKQEFKQNTKFKSLMRANKASGGSAPGQISPALSAVDSKLTGAQKLAAYHASKK